MWSALRAVPAGETVSYAALARGIGRPDAARAVGAACGANPIWLVVPCHRAIGSDGRLVGYAGGLERKGWLLHHEQMAHGVAGRREGDGSGLNETCGPRRRRRMHAAGGPAFLRAESRTLSFPRAPSEV